MNEPIPAAALHAAGVAGGGGHLRGAQLRVERGGHDFASVYGRPKEVRMSSRFHLKLYDSFDWYKHLSGATQYITVYEREITNALLVAWTPPCSAGEYRVYDEDRNAWFEVLVEIDADGTSSTKWFFFEEGFPPAGVGR